MMVSFSDLLSAMALIVVKTQNNLLVLYIPPPAHHSYTAEVFL